MLDTKSSRRLVVFYAGVFVFVLIWLAIIYPDYGKICSETQQATAENCLAYNITSYYLVKSFTFIQFYNGAIIALFTVILAVSTVLLWNVTKRAADAAALNAQAIIDAERAHLFVIVNQHNLRDALAPAVMWPNSPEMDDGAVSNRPALDFTIRNLGKTAAIMSEVSYQVVQARDDQTVWEFAVQDTIVNPVIAGGDKTDPPTPCVMETTYSVRDSRHAWNGERPLFFFGYVTFRDTFNREYTYSWRYRNHGMRYVLIYQKEHEGAA